MTDTLASYLVQKKKEHSILLMSHLVLGYPSLEENERTIQAMVEAGVDLMELQLPFSEPNADGPVIARANQSALDAGFRLEAGLALIERVVARHDIPFLIMTYFNLPFTFGLERFLDRAAGMGVRGLIVPDLPLELAGEAMAQCRERELSWIQLMAPTCRDERLREIGQQVRGFCYCVARRGVTGRQTRFDQSVEGFLARCRAATSGPLAVGFGVKSREDVLFLSDHADIAVVGTAAITIGEKEGSQGVGRFFRGLR